MSSDYSEGRYMVPQEPEESEPTESGTSDAPVHPYLNLLRDAYSESQAKQIPDTVPEDWQ